MQNFVQTLIDPVIKFELKMTNKSSAVEIDIQVINPTPLHWETESLEIVKSLCQKLPRVNVNIDHPYQLRYIISLKIEQ